MNEYYFVIMDMKGKPIGHMIVQAPTQIGARNLAERQAKRGKFQVAMGMVGEMQYPFEMYNDNTIAMGARE
jgi:hypothetical protein